MLDLFRRTRALRAVTLPFSAINRAISNLRIRSPDCGRRQSLGASRRGLIDGLWVAIILAGTVYAAWLTYHYLSATTWA